MKKQLASFCNILDKMINMFVNHIVTKKELNKIIKHSGKNSDTTGLKEWTRKWSELGRPNKNYYRVFSNYIGNDINIVPDNLLHNVISPILNPKRYLPTYSDKNMFDVFLSGQNGGNITPKTLLRYIDGALFSEDFTPIPPNQNNLVSILKGEKKVIVKPSQDSSSGRGVLFLMLADGKWVDGKNDEFVNTTDIADVLGQNYIVQRIMVQSQFMSALCKTSVNTLRIAVYRSIADNKCHVLNTIIRIGKDGSLVDNAHAGGMFIGVSHDGTLGKYCCDQFGRKKTMFNGIDFEASSFTVPNYDKVKEFAESVGNQLHHLRLFALDVMLDEKNNPILIEYNIKAFSPWLFQFTTGAALDKYTDEIIDYCALHKKEATRINISF